MRILGLVAIIFLIGALALQISTSLASQAELRAQYEELESRLEETNAAKAALKADLEYFQNPRNLEKELRARFNYRSPDEKIIIIVPPDTPEE